MAYELRMFVMTMLITMCVMFVLTVYGHYVIGDSWEMKGFIVITAATTLVSYTVASSYLASKKVVPILSWGYLILVTSGLYVFTTSLGFSVAFN